MGSYISSRRRTSDATAGKVVLPDGTVRTFPRGTSVAELMLEYPQHFVIELRSLMAGTRGEALPADQKLDTGRVYLVLPMKQGGAAALSAAEARRLLLRSRSSLRPGSFLPPSSACSSPSTNSSSPNSDSSSRGASFIRKKKSRPAVPGQDERGKDVINTPVFPAGVFEETQVFLNRQLSRSGRGWKPSLHTIEEMTLTRKVPHWLL
ncbi:hypothetical protein Taro_024199 [Colocasia esculenta]|uniref:Uncharacterized protein n=1 Tax=Colocasia esculenta TaxID=4460 RepID=A0A843VDS7_COLES|nr:hypothetical protein [Colocasia esculenta]